MLTVQHPGREARVMLRADRVQPAAADGGAQVPVPVATRRIAAEAEVGAANNIGDDFEEWYAPQLLIQKLLA